MALRSASPLSIRAGCAEIRLPRLRAGRLDPARFTATAWSTAADKAKWGDTFLAFCAEGFPQTRFTQAFYNRLSQCFGHIAHYDSAGFWGHFFSTTAGRIEFLEQTVTYLCIGSPAFTFSDVEKVLRKRIAESGLLDLYRAARAREIVEVETEHLGRLLAKYPTHRCGKDHLADEAVRPDLVMAAPSAPAVQLGLL